MNLSVYNDLSLQDIFGFEIFEVCFHTKLSFGVQQAQTSRPLGQLLRTALHQLRQREVAADLHRTHTEERTGRVRPRANQMDTDQILQQQDRLRLDRGETSTGDFRGSQRCLRHRTR